MKKSELNQIVYDGKKLTIEEITPRLAQEWIDWTDTVVQEEGKERLNRNLSLMHVSHLRMTMDAHKWDPLYTPIHLDETGAVINGNHRLHAVVAHGHPISNLVIRNMPRSSITELDGTVRPRTVACRLEIAFNFSNAKRVVAASRSILTLMGKRAFCELDVQNMAMAWEQEIRWAIQAVSASPFDIAPLIASFAWLHASYPEQANRLVAMLVEREARIPQSPAWALARSLSGMDGNGGQGGQLLKIYATMIAARHQVAGHNDVKLIKAIPAAMEWARSLSPSLAICSTARVEAQDSSPKQHNPA